MARSPLSLDQVRMILRIFWTDRYTRKAAGLSTTTRGLRGRLAKQFGVSEEVIKKITYIKKNQTGAKRRTRYKTIALGSLQRNVKARLRKRGIIQ